MYTVLVSKEEAASVKLQFEYTVCLWSNSKFIQSGVGVFYICLCLDKRWGDCMFLEELAGLVSALWLHHDIDG